MSLVKRKMPPSSLLQRRVKPRYEPEPESDIEDVSEGPSEEDAGLSGSENEDGEGEELSEDESGSGGDEVSLTSSVH
jgi:ribosomal RNA-processing protein 36